jgi:hypothetical protein
MPGRLFASPKVSRGGKRTGGTPHQLDGKIHRFNIRGRNRCLCGSRYAVSFEGPTSLMTHPKRLTDISVRLYAGSITGTIDGGL